MTLNTLKTFGTHCLSFSSLHSKISHFEHAKGSVAFAAFSTFFLQKKTCVLSDPFCLEKNKKDLLKSFLGKHPKACFFQVSAHTKKVLEELGLKSHQMGVESHINLSKFNPTWKSHNSLIRHANKAKQEKVLVKEISLTKTWITKIEALSKQWLQNKPHRRQAFLTRPLVLHPEEGARYFVAVKKEALMGIRFYYPMYKNGKTIGYYDDINRSSASAPVGTSYLLALDALTKFKAEGIKLVSFGLSPFQLGWPKTIVESIFKGFYTFPNPIYSFKGLCNYKGRFHGKPQPCYFMSQKKLPISELYAGLSLTLGPRKWR